jgi:hypothetical protein
MFSHLSVDEATAKVDCGAHNLSRIVKIDVDWKQMFIANVLANCTGKHPYLTFIKAAFCFYFLLKKTTFCAVIQAFNLRKLHPITAKLATHSPVTLVS